MSTGPPVPTSSTSISSSPSASSSGTESSSRYTLVIASACVVASDSALIHAGLVTQLQELPASSVTFIFISRRDTVLQRLRQALRQAGLDIGRASFLLRGEPVRNEISVRRATQRVVVLGYVNEDFVLAANFKALLLVAEWAVGAGGQQAHTANKLLKYGNPVPRVDQLSETITILSEQCTPLLQLSFELTAEERRQVPTASPDFRCDIVALSSANTLGRVSADAVEVIDSSRAVLKADEQTWKLVFRYYLLAFITNHRDLFADVQDWCVIPSSHESEVREDGGWVVGSAVMDECKEIVRHMLGGRKASPVFRRTTTILKNRHRSTRDKAVQGAAAVINYPGLVLNHNSDYDAKKLRGRVVCVFDDYCTTGNSFEAARSLLLAAGVKRVVMVALGKFGFNYHYETFCITGSPFTPTYTWRSVRRQEMDVRRLMRGDAIPEFTRLKDMVKLREQRNTEDDEKQAD